MFIDDVAFNAFSWKVILSVQKQSYVLDIQKIVRYEIKLRALLLPHSHSNGFAKVFFNLNALQIMMYNVEKNNLTI